jgi:hypothetical protein
MNDAVAITYALKKIKDGKNLQRALSDISTQATTVKEIVKSVYEEITKTSDSNSSPSNSARDKAKQIINDML